MKYIILILGVQACVLGLLVIMYMMMELAFMGIELDMVAYEYEYMEEQNAEQRTEEKLD